MIKRKLIQRLSWYYPLERIHAFVTFPVAIIYVIVMYPFVDAIFLIYGLLVCTAILYQGQHYWKLKLDRLKGNAIDQQKNLTFFRKSKKINAIAISFIPLVFILQFYLNNWYVMNVKLLLWGIVANIFAVLEHVNYYHIQLMIDNQSDVDYVLRNRKFKTASLAKDLVQNEI